MSDPGATDRSEQEKEQQASPLGRTPIAQLIPNMAPPPSAALTPLAPDSADLAPQPPSGPTFNPAVDRGSKRPPENRGYRIAQRNAPLKNPSARTPYAALPSTDFALVNTEAGTTATTTTTTTAGLASNTESPTFMEAGKQRKATSSKKRRRRGSSKARRMSSDSAKSTTKTNMIIVSDEAPDRITNPLIEPLPPRNTVDVVHGAELYCAADLVYHRPDTFPLSYLARILGFDVPVARENMEFPMPLLDVDALSLRSTKDDPFFEIPKEESKLRVQQVNAIGNDLDDHLTLDYIDPVYSALLQNGFCSDKLQPCSTTLLTKFASRQKEQGPTRRCILSMAQSMLPGWDSDWKFADWTTTKTDDNSGSTAHWTIDGKAVFSSPPSQAFGIVASYKGMPKVLLKYQFKWYQISNDKRESELVMVLQGIGQPTTEPVNVREYFSSGSPAKGDGQGAVPEALTNLNPISSVAAAATIQAISSDLFNETSSRPDAREAVEIEGACTPQPQRPSGQTQGAEFHPSPPLDDAKEPAPLKVDNETKAIELLPVSSLADDSVFLVLLAMALEHTRACDVWYGLWDAPRNTMELHKDCFRMSKVPSYGKNHLDSMVCDLKKCSTKYAMLKMNHRGGVDTEEASLAKSEGDCQERWLVRLPNTDVAKACFDTEVMLAVQRASRGIAIKLPSRVFTGATGEAQEVTVGIRAVLGPGPASDEVQLLEFCNGAPGEKLQIPERTEMASTMEILRCFPQKRGREIVDAGDSEVLLDLKKKQAELIKAEKALDPHLRLIMSKVINERLEFEKPESRQKRADQERILDEHRQAVERRKEMDKKLQEQLEQDMNAVCSICGDGEVTPDNQILFCEACNVPVHQTCYGIEEVPEGDYYCVACRYFKRDKMNMNKNPDATRVPPPILPIRCELCPVQHGAYIRTESPKFSPEHSLTKWVHMACAKWQGLNFVEKNNPECVEEVSTLKIYFRRLDNACDICQGKRGAYHKCYFEGCQKWMHMSCAMACGMCEVNYGEDVEGEVTEKPWTLMCREHSEVDIKDSGTKPVPAEELIRAAKEFPAEPMPEAPPPKNRVFNKMSGRERARALANPGYEEAFLEELMTKKFAGVKCECCDIEDSGTLLQRCSSCWATVCTSCRLTEGENSAEQKYFKCFSCRYIQQNTREGKEFDHPQCDLCCQKKGLLLNAIAKPVGRLTYWKQNPKLFEKSIFGKKLWSHYTCAFWSKGVKIKGNECLVDFSDVVMSNGKGYVQGKTPCYLCGLKGGMKTKCYDPECRARGERNRPYHFHVACARQAGYEVNHDDENPADGEFYVYCYEHGGNEYNLRARLEDLIEVERRRSGKKFGKADAPMNFNDASRLLSCSMLVVRILGWAWRWAELWVENDSTWEPLLEPGQKEEDMTKAQLKIVESTPESRCEDARRCRLAAFGAAVRNRGYDEEEKFDNESLNRALRAVLHTKSLVGPWKDFEIDFFVDWLARAYRSKSRLLSIGNEKVPIGTEDFCFHIDNKSPKYELGNRPLPGKARLAKDVIFEQVQESDDFLKPEMIDGVPVERKKKAVPMKRWLGDDDSKKSKSPHLEEAQGKRAPGRPRSEDTPAKKRGPGRPKSVDPVKSPNGSTSQFDKSAGLAALIPSALKKRGAPAPNRTTPKENVACRSPKKDSGFPVLDAEVPFDKLTPEGRLRESKRGRPPRVLNLSLVVSIGNKTFNPFSPGDRSTSTTDIKRERSSVASKSLIADVAAPHRRPVSQRESREKSSKKESNITQHHQGRPAKRLAEKSLRGLDEVVKAGGNVLPKRQGRALRKKPKSGELESARRRKKRRRPSSDTDEFSDGSEADQTEEEAPSGRRRGSPLKILISGRRSRTPLTYAERSSGDESESFDEVGEPEEPVVVKKQRGRPPKKKKTAAKSGSDEESEQSEEPVMVKKRRGRPPTKQAKAKRVVKAKQKSSSVPLGEASVTEAESDGYGTDACVPLSTLYPPSKTRTEEVSEKLEASCSAGTEIAGATGTVQMNWGSIYIVTKPARLAGKKEAAKFVFK